ncbi:hypothetical protein [Pusillimonas noertemannii]|uniref:hypothetical protein n=1 Tax=Pusillimonas noertemannii TaxID=305977 RepID=UPI0002D574A8|nr:hypothetical protein [Pusillimonas noertemannii]
MSNVREKVIVAQILKNELLVGLNKINRLSPLKFPSFVSAVFWTHSLSIILNLAVSALIALEFGFSLIFFILTRFLRLQAPPNSIFIYTDRRQLRFAIRDYSTKCIGLRKFLRTFRRGHIYSFLSLREVIQCFVDVPEVRRRLDKEVRTSCLIDGVEPWQLLSLSAFGFFRCFDLLLAHTALKKVKNIEFSSHFDVYVSLASRMRQTGEIEFLSGIQHGLYEVFAYGDPMPLYCDEYCLLFVESEAYFKRFLNANPACELRYRKRAVAFNQFLLRNDVVAVALQADDKVSDEKLLVFLSDLAPQLGFVLVAYIHPSSSSRYIKHLRNRFPSVLCEPSVRYADITVVITRYSTLAMDYVANGIPAIFWGFSDHVCVIYSDNKLIYEVERLQDMPLLLRKFFGNTEDSDEGTA